MANVSHGRGGERRSKCLTENRMTAADMTCKGAGNIAPDAETYDPTLQLEPSQHELAQPSKKVARDST